MTTKRHTAAIHTRLVELEAEAFNIGRDREVVRTALMAAELKLNEQRDQLCAANERAEHAERQVSDLRLTVDLLARSIAVQAGARFAAVGAPRAVGS